MCVIQSSGPARDLGVAVVVNSLSGKALRVSAIFRSGAASPG